MFWFYNFALQEISSLFLIKKQTNNNSKTKKLVFLQVTPSPPLPVSLSLEDSEILSFYSAQSYAHLSCLADAIDVLFTSVKTNQPPRIFVARGKSLIVTAHKLVFIGDTLSRLLTSADLRAKVSIHLVYPPL